MMRAGSKNLITDVSGLRVGHAQDDNLKSGTSVILCGTPSVAAVQVLGGGPGTRETDLLEPHNTVDKVHAICLSGGSAFGLDAAGGVQSYLREQSIGFEVGEHHIPIVPTAILFDLINGGDKDWGLHSPYQDLGYQAAINAKVDFAIGSVGAGLGALTANKRGGLGSTSSVLESGFTVGAMVAVNPMGSVNIGTSQNFWAAPFEIGNEFGGLGYPHPMPEDATDLQIKFRDMQRGGANTTIAVIATDAELTKAEAKRLAISAHDGFARAIWPCHTSYDGDLVFALATGNSGRKPSADEYIDLCAAASSTMARGIARGVHNAQQQDGDILPAWSQT
ncbi:MAG: P1 family peptidase [Lentilitoribacter sp.]